MASLEETIRKWTLKNAADYKLAIPGKIIGRVIGECPDSKADMKATMKLINEEAKRVNALSHEDVAKELAEFTFEEKKPLPTFSTARQPKLTRFRRRFRRPSNAFVNIVPPSSAQR